MPDHVADRDADPVVVDVDHVVPVAADVQLLRARAVTGRDADAALLRERTGQQALLQRRGHRVLELVELCPLERLGGEGRDGAHRRTLPGLDPGAALDLEAHDTDHGPARIEQGQAREPSAALVRRTSDTRIGPVEALEGLEPDLSAFPGRVRRGRRRVERQML